MKKIPVRVIGKYKQYSKMLEFAEPNYDWICICESVDKIYFLDSQEEKEIGDIMYVDDQWQFSFGKIAIDAVMESLSKTKKS